MHVSTPDEDVYNSRGSLLYQMSPLFSRPFCFFKIIITYLELSLVLLRCYDFTFWQISRMKKKFSGIKYSMFYSTEKNIEAE